MRKIEEVVRGEMELRGSGGGEELRNEGRMQGISNGSELMMMEGKPKLKREEESRVIAEDICCITCDQAVLVHTMWLRDLHCHGEGL